MKQDYVNRKCDYFHNFVKLAVNDLKANGICYAYQKDQMLEIKKQYKGELNITETDFGYSISVPRKKRKDVFYE